MTTIVPSIAYPDALTVGISALSNPSKTRLAVRVEGRESVTVTVDRAEFLAAVATELDVIITPRADLPEVTVDADRDLKVGPSTYPGSTNPTAARDIALRWLALAEHLDAHPPIDEAQVNTLADILGANNLTIVTDDGTVTSLARHLITTGQITVTPKETNR